MLDLFRQGHHGPAHLHRVAAAGLYQLGVKQVHLRSADKPGHKDIGRVLKYLLRGADLLDIAVLHDDDAVTQGHSLGLVVGDIDEGCVDALAKLDDLSPHLITELGIQVAERLIHQKDLGIAHDGAADGHALALTAGKRLRFTVQIAGDVQDFGGLPHLLVDLVLGQLP